ncbi:conserved hypothetical protein [uncultured Desulfovibrio sp.]|uniref:Methyltransferase type 11 domain-containing protein n=1 Tax=uncultured Desulfovibrio sp. TaxID=167968 RepID=A0A212IYR3_9BACT|nr:methyltransferase domain-containing protein [uncultured Desulfovibrio sp.]SBV92342.1 conserved hypothetical protein [uncultured Desulfovibrio sp.]
MLQSFFFWRKPRVEVHNEQLLTPCDNSKKAKINIGAGAFSAAGWTNLDFPSEWYSSRQTAEFIPFDIRKDALPFANSSITLAYCSHVIEHIEEEYIRSLFADVYRVLRPKGVFRVICPDAEALYMATKHYPQYWSWRDAWFQGKWRDPQTPHPKPLDYLVREIATPRCKQYIKRMSVFPDDILKDAFETMAMDEFLNFIVHKLQFRPEAPGDHIQWYSFEKLSVALQQAGFTVIRSGFGGSVHPEMQDVTIFDTKSPMLSLYVDAIKK